MKYSDAAYTILRIMDLTSKYKNDIPEECLREINRECVIFLDKLRETYFENETD